MKKHRRQLLTFEEFQTLHAPSCRTGPCPQGGAVDGFLMVPHITVKVKLPPWNLYYYIGANRTSICSIWNEFFPDLLKKWQCALLTFGHLQQNLISFQKEPQPLSKSSSFNWEKYWLETERILISASPPQLSCSTATPMFCRIDYFDAWLHQPAPKPVKTNSWWPHHPHPFTFSCSHFSLPEHPLQYSSILLCSFPLISPPS